VAAVVGIYETEEVAELLPFSARWVRKLVKRYNEGGSEALGDQRVHNGAKSTILTPAALVALKERIKTPPDDDGGLCGRKIARWLAHYHGLNRAGMRSLRSVIRSSSRGHGILRRRARRIVRDDIERNNSFGRVGRGVAVFEKQEPQSDRHGHLAARQRQ
jgi:hypothetical protein